MPQSISVISGSTLEEQHADNFTDYLKLVPGLQLNQDTPGQGRLVIRGINTGGVASTVGIYMDETPFGSSSGLVNASVWPETSIRSTSTGSRCCADPRAPSMAPAP